MSKYNFITTPAFTSLLSEISKNAKKGRIFEADEDKDDEVDPTAEEQPAPEGEPSTDAPTEEPAATPEPTPAEPVESPDDAGNEADLAQAELEKAKVKKASAEEELEEQRYIKLVSPSGVTALLQLVLEPAIKTNQIDGLARNLVGKLAIETEEDFKAFKEDTIAFRGIVGFPQLIESMGPFIGGPEAALQPTSEPAL
jgi:hypothetical protein